MAHNKNPTRRQREFVDHLFRLKDPIAAYAAGFGFEGQLEPEARRHIARRSRQLITLPAVRELISERLAQGETLPDMHAPQSASPRQVIEALRRMSQRGSEAMAPLSADDLFQLESAAAELHELVSAELGRRRRSTRLRRAKRSEAATLTEAASEGADPPCRHARVGLA